MPTDPRPILVLDLDDTLLKTDLLFEQAFRYLKTHPLDIHRVIILTRNGYLAVKRYLAERIALDPAVLPYREQILEIARRHKEGGGKVVLASASPDEWVQSIANSLNHECRPTLGSDLFDAAFGSKAINLRGAEKLKALRERIGSERFIYAGDSDSDLEVWKDAFGAIAVNVDPQTAATLKSWLNEGKLEELDEIYDSRSRSELTLRAMRPSYWIKNLLVLAPLFIVGGPGNPTLGWKGAIAVLCFGIASSSAYLFNDLLDVDHDRMHPKKKNRPFAAGELHLTYGMGLAPALAVTSLAMSLLLPLPFTLTVATYLALNVIYSVWWRRRSAMRISFQVVTALLRVLSGVFLLK